MKESMWGYLIIILGVVILAVLILVQRLTTANEEDYYLSREVLRAAMLDAVDYGTYMNEPHKLVMSREKFVSVFTRRFADSVTADKDYRIDFYDIYEYPPKATIRISTDTGETVINDQGVNIEVNTFITGILETSDEEDGLFAAVFKINGDVDDDGNTTITDGRSVLEWASNELSVAYHPEADVNNDGVLDFVDAANIESAVLGKYKQGDINMDGVVDDKDYKLYDSNLSKFSREMKILADVNGDGKVNSDDKTLFKNYLDGKAKFKKGFPGDVNNDGRVTAVDVMWLSQYLEDKRALPESYLPGANVDEDKNDKITQADLKLLINMLLDGKYSYK